jgi:hypothetical protein
MKFPVAWRTIKDVNDFFLHEKQKAGALVQYPDLWIDDAMESAHRYNDDGRITATAPRSMVSRLTDIRWNSFNPDACIDRNAFLKI